jgi:hypothetical protein
MRESCGGDKIEKALEEKMEVGYERHYLKIMGKSGNGEEEFGLACINVDQTQATNQRAFIRHLSVLKLSHLKKALGIVMDFVWKKINCEHVRVEVFHFVNAEGAMKVD